MALQAFQLITKITNHINALLPILPIKLELIDITITGDELEIDISTSENTIDITGEQLANLFTISLNFILKSDNVTLNLSDIDANESELFLFYSII